MTIKINEQTEQQNNDIFLHATVIKNLQIDRNEGVQENPPPKTDPNSFFPSSETEIESPPKTEKEIIVYKTRFWILAVFSFVVFMEFNVWGTFGSIYASAEYAYNWTDGYVALLDAWGPINSVLFMAPMSWFNQKYGLRKGVLGTALLVTIGTAARCITTNDVAFTYLASFAAILCGMSSCLTQSLPSMVSNTWFPPNERTTATAIGMLTGQLGSTAFYLSPLLVRSPPLLEPANVNGTTVAGTFSYPSRDEVKSDIRTLMFIHFGGSLLALICVIVYFPEKPKNSPSISSTEERIDHFKSMKVLFRNKDFVLITITYVFIYTFPVIWFSIMNFSLQCIGVDQNEAMFIGITASLVAAAAALTAARVTDRLQGHMRATIGILIVVASGFFLWFLLITEKVIVPSSKVQVYIAVTGGVATSYAAVPIVMELAVEIAYPCPESAVGAVLIFFMDFTGIIFLLMMIIPSDCYRWISYVLAIGVFSTLCPLLAVKENRKRSAIDSEEVPSTSHGSLPLEARIRSGERVSHETIIRNAEQNARNVQRKSIVN